MLSLHFSSYVQLDVTWTQSKNFFWTGVSGSALLQTLRMTRTIIDRLPSLHTYYRTSASVWVRNFSKPNCEEKTLHIMYQKGINRIYLFRIDIGHKKNVHIFFWNSDYKNNIIWACPMILIEGILFWHEFEFCVTNLVLKNLVK